MNSASDEPTSPRSTILDDFASAREAVGGGMPVEAAVSRDQEAAREGPPAEAAVSSGLLGVGVVVGGGIAFAGALTFSLLGAIGALLGLGLAVAAFVMLFRRARTIGRFGLAALVGVLALVVGLALGIRSYDEKYFGDRADRELWDAVSLAGFLLTAGGLLVLVVSILALLVAAVVGLFRRG